MRNIADRAIRKMLLTGLDGALRRYPVTQNRDLALNPEIPKALANLARIVGNPEDDLDAARTIGLMHWLRYNLLPSGEDQQDWESALFWLGPVHLARPDQLPERIRSYFTEHPPHLDRALLLLDRYAADQSPTTIGTAIDLLRRAVRERGPDRARRQALLAEALRRRGELTGSRTDLDEAVRLAGEALSSLGPTTEPAPAATADSTATADSAAEPAGVPAVLRAELLSRLQNILVTRAHRTGSVADLDAALEHGRAALDLLPPGHAERAAVGSNLGHALRVRFDLTGDTGNLDEAVTVGAAAAAEVEPAAPWYGTVQGNLSNVLRIRAELSGSEADLTAAVRAARLAVAHPAPDPATAARHHSYLCNALSIRHERTGSRSDIEAAVTAGREAARLSPPAHQDHAGVLGNLANALRLRVEVRPDTAGAAVEAARAAVAAAAPDDPSHAVFRSNLANALQLRGRADDLHEAVRVLDEAVRTARGAASASNLPLLWHNLGNSHRLRFELLSDPADVERGVAAYQAAAASTPSPARAVLAAQQWGWLAALGGQWSVAVRGYERAAELTGRVAPHGLSRLDREFRIAETGVWSASAMASCLHLGQVERAVELFEQSRGVLLGQAMDLRTDVTDLAAAYPRLATRFEACRDALEQAATLSSVVDAESSPTGTDSRAGRLAALADDLDRVVAEIRRQPRFEGFLQPPRIADLLRALPDGHVVVVNCSELRSDAVVLGRDGVRATVPLPALTPDAVLDRVRDFLAALDEIAAQPNPALAPAAQRRLGDTLGWLWDAVTGPVLTALGIDGPPAPGRDWPRVWWCPAGLLSFLPLHAAGDHDTRFDADPQTVIDRVVSSHTPTLRALTTGGRPTGRDTDGRGLVVAMPRTPGNVRDLPGALAEAEFLAATFGDRADVLVGDAATRSAVVDRMPGATWVHFACHGLSDPDRPSSSRLLLQDHADDPFTVPEIARLRLTDGRLAFLSACSTASATARLTDEAIHLTSAFQLAGFRQVVGSLWSVLDDVSGPFVSGVYGALLRADDPEPAGVAVHHAVRRLRALWAEEPSVWAAYLHVGVDRPVKEERR